MKQINSKLTSTNVTIFTEMSALALKHHAINLGQGFPDYNPPKGLLDLIHQNIYDKIHQYAPMQGNYRLREVISEKIMKSYGTFVHPDTEITITAGATQAIFTAIEAFVHPADEVIIFEPAYDAYRPAIEIAGGECKVYTMVGDDFSIDWGMVKSMTNSNTKMIIINTPHNPSSTILDEDDMKSLQNIVRDTDIIILSDEVYEHLIFDGSIHQSVLRYPELYSRSLAVFSFGKTFHATGWKTGYIAGPDYLMREFRKIHQWNVFCVNSIMQDALSKYLSEPEHYDYLPGFYQAKRDYFLERIKETPFKPLKSEGTFFQVVDYSAISQDDDITFAKWMTEKIGVTAIPLSVFYSKNPEQRHIRFCFAKTENLLDLAGERLSRLK